MGLVWGNTAGNAARSVSPGMPLIRAFHTEPYGSAYDASFAALSDATRRGVLEQLGRADASITDLAEKFHMTLTGMKKHVGVLERAGLVTTEKIGRVRPASSAYADWRKRRHGSRGIASSGTHASTIWTRLSRN
jgi:DNA-binding transcriptional ArsR family regulator